MERYMERENCSTSYDTTVVGSKIRRIEDLYNKIIKLKNIWYSQHMFSFSIHVEIVNSSGTRVPVHKKSFQLTEDEKDELRIRGLSKEIDCAIKELTELLGFFEEKDIKFYNIDHDMISELRSQIGGFTIKENDKVKIEEIPLIDLFKAILKKMM